MARKAYMIPLQFASPGVTLTWPAIGNYGVYRTSPGGSPPTETLIHQWADTSQPPLKRV
jgi:hypothetical protein